MHKSTENPAQHQNIRVHQEGTMSIRAFDSFVNTLHAEWVEKHANTNTMPTKLSSLQAEARSAHMETQGCKTA